MATSLPCGCDSRGRRCREAASLWDVYLDVVLGRQWPWQDVTYQWCMNLDQRVEMHQRLFQYALHIAEMDSGLLRAVSCALMEDGVLGGAEDVDGDRESRDELQVMIISGMVDAGLTLRGSAELNGVPIRTVYYWITADPGFAGAVARARGRW